NEWFENEVIRLEKTGKLPKNKKSKIIEKGFEKYSQDLGFEMFIQSTQVAIAPDSNYHYGNYVEIDQNPPDDPITIIDGINEMKSFKAPNDPNKYLILFSNEINEYSLNKKLLNSEYSMIRFIADRINEGGRFKNLRIRLFQIVESSKSNQNISSAAANAVTIL